MTSVQTPEFALDSVFESREGGRRRGGLGGGRRWAEGKDRGGATVDVGGEDSESDMEYLRGSGKIKEKKTEKKAEDLSNIGWSGFAEDANRERDSNDVDTQNQSLSETSPWSFSATAFR